MVELVLGLLIACLGSDRFRVREAATQSLVRLAEHPQVRLELARACKSRDPEIARRASLALETWAAIWPTGERRYPWLTHLEKASGRSWPALRAEVARFVRWVRRRSLFWWEDDPISKPDQDHLIDASERAAAVAAVQQWLAAGGQREVIVDALDRALALEKQADSPPEMPPAGR